MPLLTSLELRRRVQVETLIFYRATKTIDAMLLLTDSARAERVHQVRPGRISKEGESSDALAKVRGTAGTCLSENFIIL